MQRKYPLEPNAPSQLLLPTRLKPLPLADPTKKGRVETGETGMEIVPKGKRPAVAQPKAEPESSGELSIPERNPNLVMETQPESLGQPPAELQASKSPKGYVVLAIGLPGSGKTTWFKRRGVTPLSSDMLRSILFDDITEQRYQGLVFSTLRSLLRARLIAKMPWNYVDATNLSPHEDGSGSRWPAASDTKCMRSSSMCRSRCAWSETCAAITW